MGKGVRVRNTSVNGGMTGRDTEINKLFAYKDGNGYSTMKKFNPASNPNSEAQQLVRSTFAQTSAGWSALTDDQRNLWNQEAPNWVNTGVFGDTKQSGKNLFTGCNVALVLAGVAMILEPNRKALLSTCTASDLSLNAGVLSFNATFDTNAVDEIAQLHVSKQLTAGTSKNTKFAILKNVNCGADIASDVTAEYVAKYGALLAGQKIFYMIKMVSAGGNVTTFAKGTIIVG